MTRTEAVVAPQQLQEILKKTNSRIKKRPIGEEKGIKSGERRERKREELKINPKQRLATACLMIYLELQ